MNNENSIWDMCFGSDETVKTILASAESDGITPQDFAMTCIVAAQAQGMTVPTDEAYACLCAELGVSK